MRTRIASALMAFSLCVSGQCSATSVMWDHSADIGRKEMAFQVSQPASYDLNSESGPGWASDAVPFAGAAHGLVLFNTRWSKGRGVASHHTQSYVSSILLNPGRRDWSIQMPGTPVAQRTIFRSVPGPAGLPLLIVGLGSLVIARKLKRLV